MIGGLQMAAGAALLAVVGGLAGWVWIERGAAADLRERAVAAERAASDARAAAVANAAAADWQRSSAEAEGRRAAALERTRGEIETRVVHHVREVYRASDAYSPARAALHAALVELRRLNSTGPGAPRADPAAEARGAAGDPAAPGPAGAVTARPAAPATEGAIGAYCVALLGHVILLEERIVAIGRWWDAVER